ncbi:MAG: efflux transporter periplasmic adaptor subunit, partial [Candidatus Sulfotelmatobacter sp.]
LSQGTTTVIKSGVAPGEVVVTDGQDKLQTGSSIAPRTAEPGTAAAEQNGGNLPDDSVGTSSAGNASR